MPVAADTVCTAILDMARAMEENRQLLSDLDTPIGDGDHGHNMARGFAMAAAEVRELPRSVMPCELIRAAAVALIANVGGASGPLYGTLFLRAAASVEGKRKLSLQDLSTMLEAGIDGVKRRGKAAAGEKTMLDVLVPVWRVVAKEAADGCPGREALGRACTVAEQCVVRTKSLVATKGRAAHVGERGLGHMDPGAMSCLLIIRSIYQSIGTEA